MAGRREPKNITELIAEVCFYFNKNPKKETLILWADELSKIPSERIVELFDKIKSSWDSWNLTYGVEQNTPKRIWATYHALPKPQAQEVQDFKPVPREKVREFLDGFKKRFGVLE